MICLYNHFHIDEREGTAYTNWTWCVTTDDKRILKNFIEVESTYHEGGLAHRVIITQVRAKSNGSNDCPTCILYYRLLICGDDTQKDLSIGTSW